MNPVMTQAPRFTRLQKTIFAIIVLFLIVDEVILPAVGISFRPSPMTGVAFFLAFTTGVATSMAMSFRAQCFHLGAAMSEVVADRTEDEDSWSLYHVALINSPRDYDGGVQVCDRYTVKDYKVEDIVESFLNDIPTEHWFDWSVIVSEYKQVNSDVIRNTQPKLVSTSTVLTCGRCYGLKATCGH